MISAAYIAHISREYFFGFIVKQIATKLDRHGKELLTH